MTYLNSKQASAIFILLLLVLGAIVYQARDKTAETPFLTEEMAQEQNIEKYSLNGKLTAVSADSITVRTGQVMEVSAGKFEFVEEEKAIQLTDSTEYHTLGTISRTKAASSNSELEVGKEVVVFVSSYPYGNKPLTADSIEMSVPR